MRGRCAVLGSAASGSIRASINQGADQKSHRRFWFSGGVRSAARIETPINHQRALCAGGPLTLALAEKSPTLGRTIQTFIDWMAIPTSGDWTDNSNSLTAAPESACR